MKFIKVVLFFSITAFSCTPQIITPSGSSVASLSNKDVIEWSETRKLVWADFMGSQPEDSKQNAAVTNCGFGFTSNKVTVVNKPKMTVTNVFNRNLSWVKPSQINRRELLEHEQLHFDISELYARKLRKEFLTTNLTYFNIKKKTESIFNEVHKQYIQRQQEYESQTNYSLNLQKQSEWIKIIKEELNGLKEYSK
ncbi:MAG TPA: hypothetical protein VF622_04770 [Segetibacter sp.]|jgi:hypothetical protein